MRYIWQHLQNITGSYIGEVPLAHYLKHYFKQYPKLGSRDRRIISDMSYSWYRCEKGLDQNLQFEEKVGLCLYLCGMQSKYVLPYLPAGFDVTLHVQERIQTIDSKFNIQDIFPFGLPLSEGIDEQDWLQSMLVQPKLFIRVRKEMARIQTLLNTNEIPFQQIGTDCLALPNGAPVDKLLPETAYVVQDLSSQKTGQYFEPKKHGQWYDCCSGAGGKSLLLKDLEPTVQLTVTDRRESILHNLKQRFKLYDHTLPVARVVNVDDAAPLHDVLGTKTFDGIICDVPCTGSGTWARTPEQLYFFNPEKLKQLSVLQAKIAINAAKYLKTGGKFLYITCSVFAEENVGVVDVLQEQTGFSLEQVHLLNGLQDAADSMFIAVLQKNRA